MCFVENIGLFGKKVAENAGMDKTVGHGQRACPMSDEIANKSKCLKTHVKTVKSEKGTFADSVTRRVGQRKFTIRTKGLGHLSNGNI
jgi:hypothetical protein